MGGENCEEGMLKGELRILDDEQKSGQSEFAPNRQQKGADLNPRSALRLLPMDSEIAAFAPQRAFTASGGRTSANKRT